MIRQSIEKVEEAKKIALDSIYKEVTNPYDDLEKKIGGVNYSSLEDVQVPAKTMFYARNKNGKDVSVRAQTGFRAKIANIGGKEFYVTNKLSYPSKKWIKEVMFAEKKMNEEVSADDVEYFGQLANQAKKDKKSKKETQELLKKAGAPRDIIADLTQRW